MEKTNNATGPALVFVYNADSGFFNAVFDTAHKAFSPNTYECNLCALTYSTFRMRKSWKRFLSTVERPLEFLHADELKTRYQMYDVSLPAIFEKRDGKLKVLLEAKAINECRTIDELMKLVRDKIG